MRYQQIIKGQTLIEVLVALGIAVVIITAITAVVLSALNNAQFSKNQSLATEYAQQGMESLRQMRDSNYPLFATYNGSYCLGTSNPPLLSPACTVPNVGIFVRSVQIASNSPACNGNGSQVHVMVSWNDNKCSSPSTYCHQSDLLSCLSTVNPIQGP